MNIYHSLYNNHKHYVHNMHEIRIIPHQIKYIKKRLQHIFEVKHTKEI